MPSFATFCDTSSIYWIRWSYCKVLCLPGLGDQFVAPYTRLTALGPLTLPYDASVISMLLFNFPVIASLPCDLVLGLDWLRHVQNSAPQLVDHLSSGSLDLRTAGLSSSTLSPSANQCGDLGLISVHGGPGAVSLMHRTRHIGVVAPGCLVCEKSKHLVREMEHPVRMFKLLSSTDCVSGPIFTDQIVTGNKCFVGAGTKINSVVWTNSASKGAADAVGETMQPNVFKFTMEGVDKSIQIPAVEGAIDTILIMYKAGNFTGIEAYAHVN
ncbi:hypothetical protein B0H13DRAFT_2301487 [Mycena leptocephala]|nr:hypothetical protein B0H13DRAFT_2301487 [Mycena leptocephala]